jgi:hypothetical protein
LNSKEAAFAEYIAGMDDGELDRSAHMALVGGDVGVRQLVEMVIFKSAGKHFANMKKALAVKPE